MSITGESSSSSDKTIKLFGFELTSRKCSPETTTVMKRVECQYCGKEFTNSQALGGHQNAHKKERLKKKRLQIQARRASIGYYLTTHQQPLIQGQYKTPFYCSFSSMSSQISFGNRNTCQDLIEESGESVRPNMIQFQRVPSSRLSSKSLDLHLGFAGDTA